MPIGPYNVFTVFRAAIGAACTAKAALRSTKPLPPWSESPRAVRGRGGDVAHNNGFYNRVYKRRRRKGYGVARLNAMYPMQNGRRRRLEAGLSCDKIIH